MKDKKRKIEGRMLLGICTINLYFPDSHSLKDKRSIIKSIKLRIRNKFNVSVSEINSYDLWKNTTLGIACIGNEKRYLNGVLNEVIKFIEHQNKLQVINYKTTIL
ncbi:unnamed protein product [marine sediment metagenome]|uniref:DUF503 domain-containing protein n=1 Tax=marine sediment metagenome TaxID=412755 RepID=X0SJS8_9ZZZZ